MDDLKRVRIIVRGIVQGVGFRFFAMQLARDYGLAGWVRNLDDGSVEVEAEGEELIVNSFIKDLGIGPRSSEVTAVDVQPLQPGQDRTRFRVR
ncbi:MAG: acylphosphatase [Candidatus Krumholzibacteria bacterium]|nr:acylphosphatase [Candidatus Krumholzibacteria bacterium]